VNSFRIALANLRHPATPEESVTLAEQAIAQASMEGSGIICFPECFTPGYRGMGNVVPPPDAEFLGRAWSAIAAAAAKGNVTVVLGTERVVDNALLATALVIHRGRNHRRLPGQSPDRPFRGRHLFAGFREAGVSKRSADIWRRDLP
jgi:predicted amidohydrolase